MENSGRSSGQINPAKKKAGSIPEMVDFIASITNSKLKLVARLPLSLTRRIYPRMMTLGRASSVIHQMKVFVFLFAVTQTLPSSQVIEYVQHAVSLARQRRKNIASSPATC